jgi:hypothetical protein
MRVRPFILPLICIGAFVPCLSRADGGDASAPPGYVWCALEHLSGKVLIPTGWVCRGIAVQNGTGYRITKEEVVPKSTDQRAESNKFIFWDMNRFARNADYRTGFTIKVISGPFWDWSRLSKLAEGIFEDRKRDGRMSALLDGASGTYTTRSFKRESVETVGNVIETQQFVELLLLDTEKPTLVCVTFDCPLSAWPENKDGCEKFFATLSLFQGASQSNHSPYPTPESVTADAGQPDPKQN